MVRGGEWYTVALAEATNGDVNGGRVEATYRCWRARAATTGTHQAPAAAGSAATKTNAKDKPLTGSGTEGTGSQRRLFEFVRVWWVGQLRELQVPGELDDSGSGSGSGSS